MLQVLNCIDSFRNALMRSPL
jgi:uncharacterized UBP type Zn finger protein